MNTVAALKKTKQQLHDSGFKLTPQREATVLVLFCRGDLFLCKKEKPRNRLGHSVSNA